MATEIFQLPLKPLQVKPKTGTAAASSTTNITFSLKDDILAGVLDKVKRVYISKVILIASGELSVKFIVGARVNDDVCISPNFTAIDFYDPPKVINENIGIILTEANASAQKYSARLVAMQEVK